MHDYSDPVEVKTALVVPSTESQHIAKPDRLWRDKRKFRAKRIEFGPDERSHEIF